MNPIIRYMLKFKVRGQKCRRYPCGDSGVHGLGARLARGGLACKTPDDRWALDPHNLNDLQSIHRGSDRALLLNTHKIKWQRKRSPHLWISKNMVPSEVCH